MLGRETKKINAFVLTYIQNPKWQIVILLSHQDRDGKGIFATLGNGTEIVAHGYCVEGL
jgi:hypothetical protein